MVTNLACVQQVVQLVSSFLVFVKFRHLRNLNCHGLLTYAYLISTKDFINLNTVTINIVFSTKAPAISCEKLMLSYMYVLYF